MNRTVYIAVWITLILVILYAVGLSAGYIGGTY